MKLKNMLPKTVINESNSHVKNIESEIKSLVKQIREKDSAIDKRALSNYSDGELLAAFLNPILQSISMELTDSKGFRRSIKSRM